MDATVRRSEQITESSFLKGKVLKRVLPAIQGRPAPDAPRLKRLLLPQGELAQFHDGQPGIQYLAFLELVPGTVRGNHYHRSKEEWIYLAGGGLEVMLQDLASEAREIVPLRAGELLIIRPKIAHALRVTEAGHGIEFSPMVFDPADIHAFALC